MGRVERAGWKVGKSRRMSDEEGDYGAGAAEEELDDIDEVRAHTTRRPLPLALAASSPC